MNRISLFISKYYQLCIIIILLLTIINLSHRQKAIQERNEILSGMITQQFDEGSMNLLVDSITFQNLNPYGILQLYPEGRTSIADVLQNETKLVLILPKNPCELCIDSILNTISSNLDSSLIQGLVLAPQEQDPIIIGASLKYAKLNWPVFTYDDIFVNYGIREDFPYLMIVTGSSKILSACIPVEGHVMEIEPWLNKIKRFLITY